MTMRELAALANVSVSTVSKAFHDAEDVSEETKVHIFEVAKKYGCFGKYYKGKYDKQVIAIVCPELGSAYYSAYVQRLQKLIEKSGGIALVSTNNFKSDNQQELMDYYASYLKADGIFVIGLKTPLKKGYSIPIVALLGDTHSTFDSIQVDLAPPIKEAVAYLDALGHKRIAFAGEKLTTGKKRNFLEATEGLGGRYDIVQSEYRFEKAGEDAARQILNFEERPTAIVCAYDNIAFGVIRYLNEQGYSVPGDFSVMGMDNVNTGQYMEHSLTSIDSSPDEVCAIAWDLMQKKQKNCYYRLSQRIIVTGKLIIRETTDKPKVWG